MYYIEKVILCYSRAALKFLGNPQGESESAGGENSEKFRRQAHFSPATGTGEDVDIQRSSSTRTCGDLGKREGVL